MVPRLRKLKYSQRLKKMKLPRLYDRRVRGDMIETYKILTGKEKNERKKNFPTYHSHGKIPLNEAVQGILKVKLTQELVLP